MKIKGLIIGAIVLVMILVGVFIYFQKSNEISSGGRTEEPQAKGWIINMNYPVANAGISSIVALPIECYKNGIRNNSNIDKNYISNSADYIVNVKVNNIDISEDERVFVFEFVNFEKGELDYVPKTLQISNPYNPGIEDDSPFQKFEEGKDYRLYLEENEGEIDFVCHMEGIEELFLY